MSSKERLAYGSLINLLVGFGLGYAYCGKTRSEARAFRLSVILGLLLGIPGWVLLIDLAVCDGNLCGDNGPPGIVSHMPFGSAGEKFGASIIIASTDCIVG